MITRALVLAAGKSTRIASVSHGLPKPLLPVGGRAVIARTLDWLAESGVRDVWVNLHYRAGEIRAALGDGSRFGLRIAYALEPEILGTAGAFKNLEAQWTDATLVIYGDNLMRFDLAAFEAAHRGARAAATVALFDPARHANTRIAGGKVVLDAHGWVASFVEGPATGKAQYVNAGAYVLEPRVARGMSPADRDFGTDVLPVLASTRSLFGHVIEPTGYCLGLDTPESYRVAEELISSRQVVLQ